MSERVTKAKNASNKGAQKHSKQKSNNNNKSRKRKANYGERNPKRAKKTDNKSNNVDASANFAPLVAHEVKFAEWAPKGISSVSCNADQTIMAVARKNADIELWDISSSVESQWYPALRIPGRVGTSVEQVLFVRTTDPMSNAPVDRLYTAGLHGYITEWNLVTLTPKKITESMGGPIHSMAASPNGEMLAIGCEDGVVRIFDTDLVFKRAFTPALSYRIAEQSITRILAVAFSPDSEFVVAGNGNGVFLYQVDNGASVWTANIGNVCVWSLLYVSDDIVVGDNTGAVHFLDARFGTTLQTIKKHTAHVLALAASADLNTVFASGVDHTLVQFIRSADDGIWTQSALRRPAILDVAAVCVIREKFVVAVGADTRINVVAAESFGKVAVPAVAIAAPPLPKLMEVSGVADGDSSFNIMLNNSAINSINVWKMSRAAVSGAHAKATSAPVRVADIKLNTRERWSVTDMALSPNGRYVAYMTPTRVFIHDISVPKLKEITGVIPGHHMTFADDGHLVVVSRFCSLQCIDIEAFYRGEQTCTTLVRRSAVMQINYEESDNPEDLIMKPDSQSEEIQAEHSDNHSLFDALRTESGLGLTVRQIIRLRNNFIAIALTDNTILFYKLTGHSLTRYWKIRVEEGNIATMASGQFEETALAVLTTTNQIVSITFDADTPKQQSMPITKHFGRVLGVYLVSPHTAIAYTNDAALICSNHPSGKFKQRLPLTEGVYAFCPIAVRVERSEGFPDTLQNVEAVVVSIPETSLMLTLPRALALTVLRHKSAI